MRNIFFTCWQSVLEVLFPSCCAACGQKLMQEEQDVCFSCIAAIARTEHAEIANNGIDMLFADRMQVEQRKINYERGAAFAYYNRERGALLRSLIERGKFGNNPNPNLFYVLGREAAREYVGSALLEDIDVNKNLAKWHTQKKKDTIWLQQKPLRNIIGKSSVFLAKTLSAKDL